MLSWFSWGVSTSALPSRFLVLRSSETRADGEGDRRFRRTEWCESETGVCRHSLRRRDGLLTRNGRSCPDTRTGHTDVPDTLPHTLTPPEEVFRGGPGPGRIHTPVGSHHPTWSLTPQSLDDTSEVRLPSVVQWLRERFQVEGTDFTLLSRTVECLNNISNCMISHSFRIVYDSQIIVVEKGLGKKDGRLNTTGYFVGNR